MGIETILSLIFAGVSAICAVVSLINSLVTGRHKKDIIKLKNEINNTLYTFDIKNDVENSTTINNITFNFDKASEIPKDNIMPEIIEYFRKRKEK